MKGVAQNFINTHMNVPEYSLHKHEQKLADILVFILRILIIKGICCFVHLKILRHKSKSSGILGLYQKVGHDFQIAVQFKCTWKKHILQ